MQTLLARILRLKVLVLALALVLGGLALSLLSDSLASHRASHLIVALTQALSDVLVVTGGIGLAVDFFTARDREAADTARTRAVLKELTPEFTDAVVRGFAMHPEDLRRVATPELLDSLARNALGLRLGDDQLAAELYADLRDQAIRAAERWYDVQVDVRLATPPAAQTDSRNLMDVLIQWEYTTKPSHAVRRFACVSDREEFNDLTSDLPATNAWFMTARPGLDAASRDCFELLSFSVEREERPIRRSVRRTSQTYSASIGQDVVDAGRPVRIRHLYRVRVASWTHQLFLEIAQPIRDLSLRLDYSATDLADLRVSDLVTSMQRPRISTWPEVTQSKVVDVEIPGWLLPRAGFTLAWTLTSELPSAVSGAGKTPAA